MAAGKASRPVVSPEVALTLGVAIYGSPTTELHPRDLQVNVSFPRSSSPLALEEIPKPEPLRSRGGCWFRVGSRQLHVGVETSFRPAAKAHPAFSSADVAAVFRILTAAGVECEWDEALPGTKRFYAKDPWGNRIEVTEPAGVSRP